MNSKYYSHID